MATKCGNKKTVLKYCGKSVENIKSVEILKQCGHSSHPAWHRSRLRSTSAPRFRHLPTFHFLHPWWQTHVMICLFLFITSLPILARNRIELNIFSCIFLATEWAKHKKLPYQFFQSESFRMCEEDSRPWSTGQWPLPPPPPQIWLWACCLSCSSMVRIHLIQTLKPI